jgi:hypothetical protein
VVLLFAVPAAAHAVHERKAERRAQDELARMTASIGQLQAVARGARRVTLNGAAVFVDDSTKNKPLDQVMADVAAECGSGDRAIALADPTPGTHDGPSRPTIRLERIATANAATGEKTSLCIFASDLGPRPPGEEVASTPSPRARYTLARAIDAKTTRVISVVNASETPLAEMFPADGDAPGSDLPDVARPESARRKLTAIVDGGRDSARIYDSTLGLAAAVTSYDAAMNGLGYAVTAALPDARMYRKDEQSYAVSFLETEGGSSITIVPFDAARSSRPHEDVGPQSRR